MTSPRGSRFGIAAPLAVAALASPGCAPPTATATAPTTATSATSPPPPATPPPPARCPRTIDAASLLRRHAAAFGTPGAVAAGLPSSLHGVVEVGGQRGVTDVVLADGAYRSTAVIAGVLVGQGIDREGGWDLASGAGVVERLAGPEEEVEPRFEDWLFRRGYLGAGFDPARGDTASCVDGAHGPRVELVQALRPLGAPTLTFDLATAALIAVAHRDPDGRIDRMTFDAWSDPDPRGVRWPRRTATQPTAGTPTAITYDAPRAGLHCGSRGADGGVVTEDGDACLRPPPDAATLRWPAGGKTRVPLAFVRGSLLVRATVGGRAINGLLDSGAGITVVDATTPAGKAFVSKLDIDGTSSTQKIRFGIGELPSLRFGGLEVRTLPTASVPIPALDALGKRRPELILGYTLFAASVVRIDYARREIVLAKPGTPLARPGARAVPLRVSRGKLLVEATIEGQPAWFVLDTGNSGSLDLYRTWEDAHGVPGDRPTVSITGRFGAGTGETRARLFRLRAASVGPITLAGTLVHDGDPPDQGELAGLAGNALLSRCDAIVIDHHARTLYLEGSCRRAVAENLMMWRLARRPDPAYPAHPWIVDLVVPGSSIERAGIARGDRVLEVGGRRVTDDPNVLEPIETRPEGTKVPVVFVRDGARHRVTVELRRILP